MRLGDGVTLVLAPETVVRFGAAGRRLAVEAGETELETTTTYRLGTDIGEAVVAAGSRVRLRASDGATALEVIAGEVVFEGETKRRLAAGHGLLFGDAILEAYEISLGAPELEPLAQARRGAPSAAAAAPEPVAAASLIDLSASPDPLIIPPRDESRPATKASTVAFSIPAGESAVIHDLTRRIVVRLRVGTLCGDEASRTTFDGDEIRAAAGIDPVVIIRGSHKYKVRCGGLAASGTLRVSSDRGSRALSARHNQIVQIREPSVNGWAESPARVHGVAGELWSVSINGRRVDLDRQRRFTAYVRPAPGEKAVAIRLEHPRGGVHYYVRRRAP